LDKNLVLLRKYLQFGVGFVQFELQIAGDKYYFAVVSGFRPVKTYGMGFAK